VINNINPTLPMFLNRNSHFSRQVYDIGDFTYGGPKILSWRRNFCRLKIGKFCSIGDEVEIFMGGEHHYDQVTTYPFGALFRDEEDGTQKAKGDIVIGNDVWIGRGATILSGVTIGDGAVIGAQAVVSKNILPYAIAVGNPIRHIKFRFTDDQIESLLKIKWWDWEYKKIAEYIPLLESNDIDKFIEGAKSD